MVEKLLSVAIITYNQEAYISKTLDSVLEQVVNFEVEIIIGDDCSSDRTREILIEYQKKYPDIIKLIFNEKNLGLIKNYFNVVAHCSGKYIMECGGDDYWVPGKVNKQLSFMESNPEYDFYYGKGQILRNNKLQNLYWGKEVSDLKQLIFDGMDIPVQSACFKRTCITNYINDEDPVNKNWFSEDYPFVIWLLHNCKIYYSDDIFFVYRVLNKSLSHSANLEKKIRNTKLDFEMKSYFIKKYDYKEYVESLRNYQNLAIALIYAKEKKYSETKEYLKYFVPNTFKEKLLKILLSNFLSFFMMYFRINLRKSIW